MAAEKTLTGVWNGLYSYPDGRSTPFVATLIEGGAVLSGTTHEPSDRPGGGGQTLYAHLDGSHRGGAVTFTKAYDPSDAIHSSRIHYDGTARSTATPPKSKAAGPSPTRGRESF